MSSLFIDDSDRPWQLCNIDVERLIITSLTITKQNRRKPKPAGVIEEQLVQMVIAYQWRNQKWKPLQLTGIWTTFEVFNESEHFNSTVFYLFNWKTCTKIHIWFFFSQSCRYTFFILFIDRWKIIYYCYFIYTQSHDIFNIIYSPEDVDVIEERRSDL